MSWRDKPMEEPAAVAAPAGAGTSATPKWQSRPEQAPGFFEQKGKGGLADYLPQGVTNAMQTIDDLTQSAGGVVTRGWGANDKLTEEARARSIHTPTDIVAGVATAPYKVGSALAGGAFGAGEGALRSYGNQEGWTPEWGQIGKDAAIGGGLGVGGYALPGIWNAAKSGLQKVGAVPKLVTGMLDAAFMGAPVTTIASGTAGATSKMMPTIPTGEMSRDLLSKIAMGRGPR